jgi:hypothetical protein
MRPEGAHLRAGSMHVKFDEECDKFGGCYTRTRSRRGHKIFYGFSAHKNAVNRLISMLFRVLSAFLIREPSLIRSFALNNHQNFICFQLPECDESISVVSLKLRAFFKRSAFETSECISAPRSSCDIISQRRESRLLY